MVSTQLEPLPILRPWQLLFPEGLLGQLAAGGVVAVAVDADLLNLLVHLDLATSIEQSNIRGIQEELSQQKLDHGTGRKMAGDEVDVLLERLSRSELTSSSQAESVVR